MKTSRRLIAAASIWALAACGGGGGSSAVPTTPGAPAPTATPGVPGGPAPAFGTPSFHLTIPRRTSTAKGSKAPAFISSAIQSVKIELTADSAGIDPATLTGNPAISDQNNTTCGSGCTVAGPPSPVGSDTYTITTYDATGAAGNALDVASSAVFSITEGAANSESVTLKGIPAEIVMGRAPFWSAGSATATYVGTPASGSGFTIDVKDAAGESIQGSFATPVTISDPDTNGDGTLVVADIASCPSAYPAGNPTVAPTSVQLASLDDRVVLCYGGVAEDPLLITASVGLVTSTASFYPVNASPVYLAASGTPSSVVVGTAPPDVQLFATSGLGSTASVTFTEAGWTDAPYDQTLNVVAPVGLCSVAGPFSTFGTVGAAYDATGTIITVTANGSPTPGACYLVVSDPLTLNGFHGTAGIRTSYSSSSFGVNKTHRR